MVDAAVLPTLGKPPTNEDLQAIFAAHSSAMFRVAISVVQDAAMAEDVLQDALVKVWANFESYRGDGSLRGWILRITHNTAVSALRKARDEAWDPATLPDEGHDGAVVATVEARDDLDRLQDGLDQLDELSRSILALREVEAMSYTDIAEALDISLGQVKIRLLRARRLLANHVRSAS